MRMLEILELGAALRREAEESCDNVNEAHLFVHDVMFRAFRDDPGLVATCALHGELSSRLSAKLSRPAASTQLGA